MNVKEIRETIDNLKTKEKVSRDELQEICALFQPIETDLFLSWCPRVSKTRGSLSVLNPSEKILVVSPTILIKSNWEKNIDGWKFPVEYKSICYQSLHKAKNEYDIIILDEVDLVSENYYNILKHFTPKRWIYLTGTESYRSSVFINKLSKGRSLFKWEITFNDGVQFGILPEPQITLFGLNLLDDKTKRNQVYQIGKNKTRPNKVVKWGEHFQHLKGKREFNLSVQVTEKEWIDMLEYDMDKWKQMQEDIDRLNNLRDLVDNKLPITPEELKEMADLKLKLSRFQVPPLIISNNIKRLGNERKKFFANRKNRFIRKIINYFQLENKRVLIFANSIPQAEWIDSNYAVHSGKDSKHLVDEFNEGRISKLIAVEIISRGIDVINVDCSIIIQTSGSEASNKQRSSRNMLDLSPKLIIIYYKNSQDQVYVDRFVKQFKEEYITRISPYQ